MLRGGTAGNKPGAVNGTNGKRGFFKSLSGGGSKPKDKPHYDGDMKDGKACGQVCSNSRVSAGRGYPQAGAAAPSCAGSVTLAAPPRASLLGARVDLCGLNVRVGVAGVLRVAQRGHIQRGMEGQPHARTRGVCVEAKVVPLRRGGELSICRPGSGRAGPVHKTTCCRPGLTCTIHAV